MKRDIHWFACMWALASMSSVSSDKVQWCSSKDADDWVWLWIAFRREYALFGVRCSLPWFMENCQYLRFYGKLIRGTILDTYKAINGCYRASIVCSEAFFALFLGVFSVTLAPVFDLYLACLFFVFSCYCEASFWLFTSLLMVLYLDTP